MWYVTWLSLQEYESNKELYDLQERYEELGQVVERLQKEKEEEREEHSMSLQKLRTEMRQISDKHAQELLQAELEHKVIWLKCLSVQCWV